MDRGSPSLASRSLGSQGRQYPRLESDWEGGGDAEIGRAGGEPGADGNVEQRGIADQERAADLDRARRLVGAGEQDTVDRGPFKQSEVEGDAHRRAGTGREQGADPERVTVAQVDLVGSLLVREIVGERVAAEQHEGIAALGRGERGAERVEAAAQG